MDKELEFREARADDLDAIIALLMDDPLGKLREKASSALDPAYQKAFEAIDRDPNNRLVVGLLDDVIVGTMQLTFIPYLTHRGSWRAQVEGVRIARSQRGNGFGKVMLEWAEMQARQQNCALFQLTSDKRRDEALNFYAGLGFTASHEGFKKVLT